MKTKYTVWVAFFLNLSYAIVEFIAGGIFGSSAVLADSVHDLGDAIAIGISAFLETISNREEDRKYTLGYKRFSLLGAAGKITESQMSQLNYQVGVEGKSAEQVAKEFLQEQGLLKK